MRKVHNKYKNNLVPTKFKQDKQGYTLIWEGKWVQEHRKVMEEFIGRKLTNEETIHHLNHNRKDNRIENLMLFPNQKEHKHFENKIAQFGYTQPIIKKINERFKEYEMSKD